MKGQRQITSIKIDSLKERVKIGFQNSVSVDGHGEEEEENHLDSDYSVTSPHKPHKDFRDAMKKLRKFALELCEITVDSKELPKWTVSSIKIDGDVKMRQSRAVFLLEKDIDWTGKKLKVGPTPQVTMYPLKDESDRYANAEAMSKAIEDLLHEANDYLAGKYEGEEDSQYKLFDFDKSLETDFKG